MDKVINKITFLEKLSNEDKFLVIYRFITLAGTSVFYIIGYVNHTIFNKLFVILCISISSIILSYLYVKTKDSITKIKVLVLIETIGNCFILIPSGGFDSPFVWYSLNTFLIASLKLNGVYWIANLIIYISTSSTFVYTIIDKDTTVFLDFVKEESNLVLSFILITVALRFLSIFIKMLQSESYKLSNANKQLIDVNEKIKDSIDYIMSLYQTVHTFTNQRNKENLIRTIMYYSKFITKSDTIFFYNISYDQKELLLSDDNDNLKTQLVDNISSGLDNIYFSKKPQPIFIENKTFIIMSVKSTYSFYGVLGIEVIPNENMNIIYEETLKQIKFLADLSSIVLERFYLEEVNERLLKTEEQNRIANEIHDSILQRLFAMSTNMFISMKDIDKVSTDKISKDFQNYRSVVNSVMKDLRNTIYGWSWNKKGNNSFIEDIKEYIDEIKKLNDININFDIEGNHELLLANQKKSIYRIICETISNAVRHGKAKNINIEINSKQNFSYITVQDDGIGFDINAILKCKNIGLGLRNIHNLTYSLNGEIKIKSTLSKGTFIEIIIPCNTKVLKREEAV